MRDNYGDKISVHAGNRATVYLAVTSSFDDSLTDAALTPAKARALAAQLVRAAGDIEHRATSTVEVSSVSADEMEVSAVTADEMEVSSVSFDEHAEQALSIVETSSVAADAGEEEPPLADLGRTLSEVPVYNLTLTKDEAETLAVILARVGGTTGALGTKRTARVYADSMRKQLEALGFVAAHLWKQPRFQTETYASSIYFEGVAE